MESEEQLRDLVAEIKRASSRPPLIMIDQEGGRVDRLRQLIPGIPGAEAVSEGERAAELSGWLGRVIGMALRWFDVEVDLAPVVDIRGLVAPKGLERRTFGVDAASVTALAGEFLRGLNAEGVAGCLKHWPGIGAGSADSHYESTVIEGTLDELHARELAPFEALGAEAGAVLVGHGTYPQLEPQAARPASLSRRLTTDLLRGTIGFQGLAVTDDMEMHAVADLGTYEEIAERALMAGNDLVLFCSHVERIPELARFLRLRAEGDDAVRRRMEEAAIRREAYRAHCERLRAAAPPVFSFQAVLDESGRFLEAFASSRPERAAGALHDDDRRQGTREPGKGRTGREEWT